MLGCAASTACRTGCNETCSKIGLSVRAQTYSTNICSVQHIRFAALMSDLIDEMLVGDFDYIFDDDARLRRRRLPPSTPSSRRLELDAGRGTRVGPQRPAVAGPERVVRAPFRHSRRRASPRFGRPTAVPRRPPAVRDSSLARCPADARDSAQIAICSSRTGRVADARTVQLAPQWTRWVAAVLPLLRSCSSTSYPRCPGRSHRRARALPRLGAQTGCSASWRRHSARPLDAGRPLTSVAMRRPRDRGAGDVASRSRIFDEPRR